MPLSYDRLIIASNAYDSVALKTLLNLCLLKFCTKDFKLLKHCDWMLRILCRISEFKLNHFCRICLEDSIRRPFCWNLSSKWFNHFWIHPKNSTNMNESLETTRWIQCILPDSPKVVQLQTKNLTCCIRILSTFLNESWQTGWLVQRSLPDAVRFKPHQENRVKVEQAFECDRIILNFSPDMPHSNLYPSTFLSPL